MKLGIYIGSLEFLCPELGQLLKIKQLYERQFGQEIMR